MKSELNENLKDAISSNIDTDWDDDYGGPRNFYHTAADECEIICLEEQIKLLAKIQYEIIAENMPITVITRHINQLQNQIEIITALI